MAAETVPVLEEPGAKAIIVTSGPVFIKHLKSNVYVTLNAIGSFQCNLCSHWLIQIFITGPEAEA